MSADSFATRCAATLSATVLLGLTLASGSARAAVSEPYVSDAVTARLLVAQDGVAEGVRALSAGLELELAPGWKTYWRSPGEVGLPPRIDWTGSENIADVAFLWPAPERFRAFGIENIGYKSDVVFPLNVTLKTPGAPARLQATVFALICSELCVPHDFTLSLDIPAASGIDSAAAARIAQFVRKVPDDGSESGMAPGVAALNADNTALIFTATSATGFSDPDVFPEFGENGAFGAPDIRLGDRGRLLWATLPLFSASKPAAALQITITDGARAATFGATLADQVPEPPFTIRKIIPGVGELAWVAALALLGGLVLNVMPCVLPVLSIKLGSVIKTRGQSRTRVRAGFLVSAGGVMVFMWGLAAITLAARALGFSVGWGLQFQNPAFLALMILLVTVFSANLLGAFEITLPSSWQTRMVRADGSPGYAGDFATGAFAAVLATPCSAPFLGTAVAFALAGRAIDIFVVFTALGLGLAFPYVAIAVMPGLVTRLPKPGRWMAALKVVLGALLGLTAAWLFWVLTGVAGMRAALTTVGLVAALIVVLALRRMPQAWSRPALAVLIAASLLAPGLLREKASPNSAARTAWVAFDRPAIARLVADGTTVFVDVTADWCLTCKANKALVLDREPVAGALAAPGVVPMLADWTRPDDTISRYLQSFGRYGIPFNIVYGPGAPEGIVLPELLSTDAVLDAIKQAVGGAAAAAG